MFKQFLAEQKHQTLRMNHIGLSQRPASQLMPQPTESPRSPIKRRAPTALVNEDMTDYDYQSNIAVRANNMSRLSPMKK